MSSELSALPEYRVQRLSPSRAAGGRRGAEPCRASARRAAEYLAALLASRLSSPANFCASCAAAAAHPRRGSGSHSATEAGAIGLLELALPASRHLARIRPGRRTRAFAAAITAGATTSTARSSTRRASRPDSNSLFEGPAVSTAPIRCMNITGLVFAYMGPCRSAGLTSRFLDTYALPGYWQIARAPTLWECNWLQVKEKQHGPGASGVCSCIPLARQRGGFTDDFRELARVGLDGDAGRHGLHRHAAARRPGDGCGSPGFSIAEYPPVPAQCRPDGIAEPRSAGRRRRPGPGAARRHPTRCK